MGYAVAIGVLFTGFRIEHLRDVAREHESALRDAMPGEADETWYVRQQYHAALRFLTETAVGETVRGAGRGEMCSWGIVGNHLAVEHIIELLQPFWLGARRTGSHVLVFEQGEEGGMLVHQIVRTEDGLAKTLHEAPYGLWNVPEISY